MTTYRLRAYGAVNGSGDAVHGDYDLGNYADAAGVAIDGYATRAEAESAARAVEETPDCYGVSLLVSAVED